VLRSLYSRLAAVLAGLFFVLGISFVGVTVFSTEMYQKEVNQKLNSKLAKHIVAERLLMKNKQVNEDALRALFHSLMVMNPSIEIYLLDPSGNVLAYSAPEGKVKQKAIDLEPVRKWLEGEMTVPFLGDDPRNPDKKKAFTAARIPEKGELEGYLYIILGGEIYDSVAQKLKSSYILQLSACIILASLLFALITGLLLFAALTSRLRRLANLMDTFRKEGRTRKIDLPVKRAERPADEIDRLGSTFKEMAERIEEQMEELRESDALRRELITNVSHDLRTPLATLQGYIETLLIKEDGLSKQQRRNYLKIAIKHCEHLSNLVRELLELAKLDANEVVVRPEPFNLCELLQDVVQKFQLRAEQEQLRIETNVAEALPFVNADIGLIERVLENLLENALHYTPKGGTVRLTITPEGENMVVQVSDTGSGIPEEELPHIFDRFYKVERTHSLDSGHSGLGLAIAKKILELHGKTMNVTSSSPSGTTFAFELPTLEST
jgi:signal transduction histidine kinase